MSAFYKSESFQSASNKKKMTIKGQTLVLLFTLIVGTTMAQVNLHIEPSNTNGTAPLYVFFDATSTTGLSEANQLSNSDFSWNFDLDNVDENGDWGITKGMVVGHVFETAGTYTIQCILTIADGTEITETTTITVSDFSGTTYYISSSGIDTNDGLSESSPWQTANYAFSQLSSNVKLLFNRGDSFSNVDYHLQNLTGGNMFVGAYGNGAKPILINNSNATMELDGVNELSFSNLHMVANATSGVGNFSIENSENILLLNLELEGSSSLAIYFDDCNNMAVFDTYIHDFGVLAVFSGDGTRFSWVGNTIDQLIGTAQAEHGMRIQGGEKQFIAHSSFTNLINTKSALQIRGNSQRHVMIYQNKMDRILGVNPQNAATLSAISHVTIEANYIGQNMAYTGSLRENTLNGINIEATNISVRNNVIDGYRNAINVSHDYNGVVSGWVDIYHNTINWRPVSPQSNTSGRIVNVRDVSNVNVANNLITSPTLTEATTVGYGGANTNIVENNNIIATPEIYEVEVLPNAAADLNDFLNYVLTDSNDENYTGVTDIPVFYDAVNHMRNLSNPIVGAFVYGTETTDEEIDTDADNIDELLYDWDLFYNPTEKTVYIQCPLKSQTITISVFSSNGQLILKEQTITTNDQFIELDVSQLATGFYTIAIKSINESHYERLIKFE